MDSELETLIRRASELIRAADNILVITGAGISADSGLPTYRGVSGLYDNQATADGITIEQALSATLFQTRPEITWKYLLQIAASARGKSFNRGHAVLAWLEQIKPRLWILTQNIDGFHRAAGSQNVIEIHGTMRRLRCSRCSYERAIESLDELANSADGSVSSDAASGGIPSKSSDQVTLSQLPRCPACGDHLRPAVVLFDEWLPQEATSVLERELRRGFDLVISIGTSSAFPYILQPILQARQQGLPTIEINPATETDISRLVTLHLPLKAAEALEQIARVLRAS